MTGGGRTHALGTPREKQPTKMAAIADQRRVARCECGALLIGDSESELYEAAQLHLARDHPQLLGALGIQVVTEMAERVGGGGA